jgi:hypothetical protein
VTRREGKERRVTAEPTVRRMEMSTNKRAKGMVEEITGLEEVEGFGN